jgi:hypothetical protein
MAVQNRLSIPEDEESPQEGKWSEGVLIYLGWTSVAGLGDDSGDQTPQNSENAVSDNLDFKSF